MPVSRAAVRGLCVVGHVLRSYLIYNVLCHVVISSYNKLNLDASVPISGAWCVTRTNIAKRDVYSVRRDNVGFV
jgi:hypothetical protein